jgi:ribonuclease HI
LESLKSTHGTRKPTFSEPCGSEPRVNRPDDYLCYTDGSCKAFDGAPGGWGFFIKPPKGEAIEGWGKARGTLSKIMEYQAVAEALDAVPAGVSALVFSDNQSLVENLSRQLDTWRQNAFAKVDADIVAQVQRIAAAITHKRLTVRWQWLRSHNGNAGNEHADQLAAKGAREAKAELAAEKERQRGAFKRSR